MVKSTKVNAKDQRLQGAGIRIVAGTVIVLLVRELGWWTNLYPPEFLRTCCRPVETIGPYALFEVVR